MYSYYDNSNKQFCVALYKLQCLCYLKRKTTLYGKSY